MRSSFLRALAVAGVLFACGALARADDITFGGNSRAVAMGGAGLAVVDRAGRTANINPAALALLNRRVNLEIPGFGFRAKGIPLDKAFNHLFGNPDRNDSVGIARDFGGKDSEFGVNLNWGLKLGHLDARATGLATVRVQPNDALKAWSKNANGDVTQLVTNYSTARADIIGAAIYSLPTVGWGERISPKGSPTRIDVGARVKLMRALYTHYIADATSIANNTSARPAPELNGGSTITKDGIGLDLGLLAHPRDYDGFSVALVLTNVIEPAFRFDATDRNGAATRYDYQPRSFSFGSAYAANKALFAFDLVDLNQAYGSAQARFGAEYATRGVAFRGGYSSARGFTVGFGWKFIQIAYGARAPLEIAQTLRF